MRAGADHFCWAGSEAEWSPWTKKDPAEGCGLCCCFIWKYCIAGNGLTGKRERCIAIYVWWNGNGQRWGATRWGITKWGWGCDGYLSGEALRFPHLLCCVTLISRVTSYALKNPGVWGQSPQIHSHYLEAENSISRWTKTDEVGTQRLVLSMSRVGGLEEYSFHIRYIIHWTVKYSSTSQSTILCK